MVSPLFPPLFGGKMITKYTLKNIESGKLLGAIKWMDEFEARTLNYRFERINEVTRWVIDFTGVECGISESKELQEWEV